MSPTTSADLLCPICEQPILGTADQAVHPVVDGEAHHLTCLEGSLPHPHIDAAVESLGALWGFTDEHERDDVATICAALFLSGFDAGQANTRATEGPQPGDMIEAPTFLPSWSTQRWSGVVIEVSGGYVRARRVIDGREATTSVAAAHCRVVKGAVQR